MNNDFSFLFYSCFLTLLSICSSLYYKIYDLMILSIMIQITSINYWRRPVKGIRRNIDIITVNLSTFYNLWTAYSYSYYNFIYTVIIGATCYFLSNSYKKKSEVIKTSFFHFLVHLLPNISAARMHYHIFSIRNNNTSDYL